MKKFLITLDQFGSSQYLPIHPTNQHERSPLGGLMTLLLYGLSLAYFGYEIVDWLKNNKLPKITSISEPNGDYEEQQSDGDILEFGFYLQDSIQPNPFQPDALMFIPVVQVIVNSTEVHRTLDLKEIENFGQKTYMFVLSDLQLKYSSDSSNVNQDYIVSLRKCQDQYLVNNQKCADSSLINQFLQNAINWFVIRTYISQYNTKKQKVEKIRKITYINIKEDSEEEMQFEMELTKVNIDNGILLPTEKNTQYFSGYSIQQTSITREQSKNKWSDIRYATIYYTLAQLKTQVWIEFPKISEILADTGSIVTWILYLSLIVYKYNEYQSHLLSIEEIINTYYLDFKEFNFKKNIFGTFKSVSLNKKQYDPVKFQQLYNKLAETAGQKINFVNLTYELSRIQFVLSSLIGTENLIKMHQMGIKLEDQLESIIIKQQEQNHEPEDKKIMPADQLQSQDELNPQDLGNLRSNLHKDESIFKFSQEMYGFFMKPGECYTLMEKDQVKQMDSKEDKSFCKQTSMQLEQLVQ